jgi:manganese transport protein
MRSAMVRASMVAPAPLEPPSGLRATLRHLGPSFILVGSVVGSGELILTTTLGASVGFVMLWWVLLSCWGKSIVQAELARYTVSTGETAMRAFNRLPGKLPARRGRVSWFIWLWVASMIPTLIGGGGIYGACGQAAAQLMPIVGAARWTLILAASAALIVFFGTYERLERWMTFLVVTVTFITLAGATCLQFTPLAVTAAELRDGLRLEFPAFAVAAALGAYGGTGVNASDSMAYTYWCAEKGYARHVGPRASDAAPPRSAGAAPLFDAAPPRSAGAVPPPDAAWVRRAKGWIRVMQVDAALTVVVLTIATVPFYMLGAGVLKRLGLVPSGTETIRMLSHMYTETLGPWASVVFLIGATLILFTCMVSGLAGNAHLFSEALVLLGFVPADSEAARHKAFRAFALGAPAVMATTYFLVANPVWMITLGGIMGALMMPVVAGATLYLRYAHVDRRIAPGPVSSALLWLCSGAMVALGLYACGRILWG